MESFLVTFLCNQLVLMAGMQYNTACTNFTNATFIQSGLHDDINGYQKDVEKMGVKEQEAIQAKTGKTPWEIATVVYIGYTSVRTQSIQFSISAKPIANTLSFNANTQNGNISLSWNF